MRKILVPALLAALVGVPLAAGGLRHASSYPSSMAVLGTATAAGWQSNPAHPSRQARENSWATGATPPSTASTRGSSP